jgi:hypothetical protein
MRHLLVLGLLLLPTPIPAQSDGPVQRLGSAHWRPGGGAHAIAFSPDDKLIATAIAQHVTLWDAAAGRWRASTLAPDCTALFFTSDGLTYSTGDKLGRWNLARPGSLPRHSRGSKDPALAAILSPDSKRFAVVRTDQSTLIRDAAGRIARKLDQATDVVALAWFADSRTLAAAGRDGYVHLWDTDTGKDLRKFQFCSPSCDAARVAVAGNGHLLVVAALVAKDKEDRPPVPEISVLDAVSGRQLKVPRFYDGMTEMLACSPDGTLVISGNSTELFLWEAVSGALVRSLGDSQSGFAQATLVPDGLGVVVAGRDGAARFVDLLTDADRPLVAGQPDITCFAFSRSGERLATGHVDRIVQVWKTAELLPRRAPAKVTAEQLPALWQALAGDARGAYVARRALIGAPNLAVELLRGHLQPGHPPSPEQIAAWIADLNADQFKARDKATQALELWPQLAEPLLRKALEGKPTLEVRRRVESLLEKFAADRPTGEVLRTLRAVAVLSTIGGDDAKAVLGRLTEDGADIRVREAAKAALLIGQSSIEK